MLEKYPTMLFKFISTHQMRQIPEETHLLLGRHETNTRRNSFTVGPGRMQDLPQWRLKSSYYNIFFYIITIKKIIVLTIIIMIFYMLG
jgi:mRNA-degrading endonuclease RelE of RelBE toxin-antitoxin system